jgi:hypothetical protein
LNHDKRVMEGLFTDYTALGLKVSETKYRHLNETSMIHLTQTRMKIHHASSIRPIKNKLFTDETNEVKIVLIN